MFDELLDEAQDHVLPWVEIPLTQGYVTYVDKEDAVYVRKFRWFVDFNNCGTPYARSKRCGFLHQWLMNVEYPLQVDHINNNTLDNRRSCNLRVVNQSENNANRRKKRSKSSTPYKGVTTRSNRGAKSKPWRAVVNKDKQALIIGYYATALEAALAYDEKLVELFGEYAKVNFPERIKHNSC